MSDSLFGFSSIAAFTCTLLIFMMIFYFTYKLHFKIKSTLKKPCIYSIVEVWVIFGLFFISTILSVISAFGWCEDDKKETRIKLLIFPLIVTFSCWIYLLVRFGMKRFKKAYTYEEYKNIENNYYCKEFINGYMRSFIMMVISASFIFHIQCFV